MTISLFMLLYKTTSTFLPDDPAYERGSPGASIAFFRNRRKRRKDCKQRMEREPSDKFVVTFFLSPFLSSLSPRSRRNFFSCGGQTFLSLSPFPFRFIYPRQQTNRRPHFSSIETELDRSPRPASEVQLFSSSVVPIPRSPMSPLPGTKKRKSSVLKY